MLHYQALAEELTTSIEDGRYRVGDKLPSVRSLMARTGRSLATVTRALAELERRGLIEARARAGTFVLPRSQLEVPSTGAGKVKPRPAKLHELTESIVEGTGHRDLVPLGGAALSPELVPVRQLARTARAQLTKDPAAFARYSEPAGLASLRRQIAQRIPVGATGLSPDEVVITQGCMDAVRLCVTATAKAGDIVVVESPTFFGFLQLIRDLGLYALEIPVDPRRGMVLDELEQALAKNRVACALLTPTFQNPTGASMDREDRQRLVGMCRAHDVPIVEDDVYGELAWGCERPVLLKELDPDNVMYVSSFSKTLVPGVRTGYVSPGRFLGRIKRLKLSGSICSPLFTQAMLSRFLEDGAFDRHLAHLQGKLRSQVAQMRDAVARHFPPGTRLTDPDGGYLLWAELGRGANSAELYLRALDEGVHVLPGVTCSLGPRFRRFIRLSCGHPFDERTDEALAKVGRLVQEMVEAS